MILKALVITSLTFAIAGCASPPSSRSPAVLKYSRIIDLTVPIESNMPGIPGIGVYANNPSKVDVVSVISQDQKAKLQSEGMTLGDKTEVNGRSMISVLNILVHNGTHIDAPRHMIERGSSVDQLPLESMVKQAVVINIPDKGPNSSVSVQDILDTGVEFGPDVIPVINTGWTEKMWGKPGFWEQMPYLEAGVGDLLARKGVTAVAMDVFPEKPLWRGVKLAPGEVWVANHLAMLNNGITMIQFVTNVSKIGKDRFILVAAPLNIKGGEASPARVFALVN
jgi:arylformamidase